MKSIPDSMRLLRDAQSVDSSVSSVRIDLSVPDSGGALHRTRVFRLGGYMLSPSISDVAAGSVLPVVMAVLSIPAFRAVDAMSEKELSNYLDVATVAIALETTVVPVYDGTDVSFRLSHVSVDEKVIKQSLLESDTTVCGTGFYIVFSGGSAQGDLYYSVQYERVSITNDEYMKYFVNTNCS